MTMMTDQELEEYFDRLRTPERGREIIRPARKSPPVRSTQGRKGNVTTDYRSRKMRLTIQTESLNVELPAVIEFETNPRIFEFYNQPYTLPLKYESKSGRNQTVRTTFDFLVLEESEVYFVECKEEDELERLSAQMPNRFKKNDKGEWYSPPVDDALLGTGIKFKIYSSKNINWIFQRSINFIENYLRSDYPPVSEIAFEEISIRIKQKPGLTITQILEKLEIATIDDVLASIAQNLIYVDWRKVPLPEYDKVHLYLDELSAQVYKHLVEDNEPLTIIDSPSSVYFNIGDQILFDGTEMIVANRGVNNIYLSPYTRGSSNSYKRYNLSHGLVELPQKTFETLIQDLIPDTF